MLSEMFDRKQNIRLTKNVEHTSANMGCCTTFVSSTMLKSRLNASTLLAEMFDRKQNILLTKMLNTRHQTWGAKRFNIVELTNVVQQC